MSEWSVKTIGELCDIGNGKVQTGPFGSQLHQSDYQAEGYPFVMPKDLINGKIDESSIARVSINHVERLSKHKLSLGDIIYGRRGDIGRQALVRQENIGWLCGSGCLRISLGDAPIDARFLHLYLKLPEVMTWVENHAIGATMPNLNTKILRSVPVHYPANINHQRQIVASVSAYDDSIANNDRRIALLEKMAEEIYREWFVRLRFPGHEQVTSQKGTPADWKKKRFDEFCLLQRGYDLPDDKVKPGVYPVIASTSIKTYHDEFKVRPPVITTGRSGSLGTVLFVDSPAWALNTTLFVKNFFGNSPYLIYYTLKFLKLENFNAGAGVPSLNRNHLGGLHMFVPPKSLQNRFNEKISVIFQQKKNLIKSNEILKQTRDRLLTRLISGKLSVEDLNIQFPPSMISDL